MTSQPQGSPTEAPLVAGTSLAGSLGLQAGGTRPLGSPPRRFPAATPIPGPGVGGDGGSRALASTSLSLRSAAPRTCSWSSCRTQRMSDEVSTPGPGEEEGTPLLPAVEAVLTPILNCTDPRSSPGLGTRARSPLTPQEPIISLILGAHSCTVLHRRGVF